jgi:putative flippase GtrA
MEGLSPEALVLQAFRRWFRFNLVGILGFVVQMVTLVLLLGLAVLPDLAALAVAVFIALSHNFLWHERVTWPDRPAEARLLRFARFQLSSGSFSLISNLGLTKVVMLLTGMPVVASNVLAVAGASLLNFALNDRVVFRG